MSYNILSEMVDGAVSFANESNAYKALEKKFGHPGGEGPRRFNVLFARNRLGRVVPIINVDSNYLGTIARAGFLVVN